MKLTGNTNGSPSDYNILVGLAYLVLFTELHCHKIFIFFARSSFKPWYECIFERYPITCFLAGIAARFVLKDSVHSAHFRHMEHLTCETRLLN